MVSKIYSFNKPLEIKVISSIDVLSPLIKTVGSEFELEERFDYAIYGESLSASETAD